MAEIQAVASSLDIVEPGSQPIARCSCHSPDGKHQPSAACAKPFNLSGTLVPEKLLRMLSVDISVVSLGRRQMVARCAHAVSQSVRTFVQLAFDVPQFHCRIGIEQEGELAQASAPALLVAWAGIFDTNVFLVAKGSAPLVGLGGAKC